MKQFFLFFNLFFLLFVRAVAQYPCGNDRLQQKYYSIQPKIKARADKFSQEWQLYNSMLQHAKIIITGTDTSYEIPTVVHIVHTGGAVGTTFNPSDAAINNLIDYLNQSWSATWPTYADTLSGGTRIPIKFVLAKRSPTCAATNGINRVNGAVLPNYVTNGICPFGLVPGPSDAEVKRLSLWPTRDFFNIWLVNKIEGGGVAGYAPWPWFVGADLIDGAVIESKYALPVSGAEYYQALPHELGHSFGLYHTFQDGCHSGATCLTEGDELCDTEPHDYVDGSCDEGNVNACTGVLFKGVEYNIMNYTTCPNRFTKDQRKRVLFTTRAYRLGLVNSMGTLAPDPSFVVPKYACVPGIVSSSSISEFGPHNISFADIATSSSGYYSDGQSYLDRTCIQQTANLIQGKTYPIAISTKEAFHYVKVWIDYNNDGIFQSSELVYTHDGTASDEIHSGLVFIPASGVVINTNLRMRVKADIAPIVDACSNVQAGQTEDYTVKVSAGTAVDEQILQLPWSIAPNPTQSFVEISCAQPFASELYGSDGRLILSTVGTSPIDMSNLSTGVYYIKLLHQSTRAFIGVQKVLKN